MKTPAETLAAALGEAFWRAVVMVAFWIVFGLVVSALVTWVLVSGV